jgi:membrane protease YdiL (CAAX protease family)
MMLLSIIAGLNVLYMRNKGSVLPYEPRRPVPWGPVGCVLAMTFLLMTALAAFGGEDHSSEPETASGLIQGMLLELLIVGGFLALIAAFTKAKLRDIGLPTKSPVWIRDVCVGAAACLAALAPVLVLQELLVQIFFPTNKVSGHPLIKALTEAPPAPVVFFLSGVFAVVVAPICEEITFRLLLQGWLERWEDERLGWRKKAASELPVAMATTAHNGGATAIDPSASSSVSPIVAQELSIESEPPNHGIAGLPYGWFPIVLSAMAFGLAHFGYGPEPIPLFLLALVLGFLYQRTHRIIPGIVAHALFNLFSMIALWRTLYR